MRNLKLLNKNTELNKIYCPIYIYIFYIDIDIGKTSGTTIIKLKRKVHKRNQKKA